jgi:hypothetical protein
VDRGTMARADRAQRARLAGIARAYDLELRDLQRPIERRYSAAAASVRFSDGQELSPYSISRPWFA